MTDEPLKPIGCPICGRRPVISNHLSIFGVSNVCDIYCSQEDHKLIFSHCQSEQAAIAAWNRRAEPIGNSDELWDWLARRIRNVTYGYQKAADGYYYRDGYHDALEWVLSLKKENK